MLNTERLPRQARDKHRESTQKRGRFLAGAIAAVNLLGSSDHDVDILSLVFALLRTTGTENHFFVLLLGYPFYTENDHFTKTGSGQTEEKLRENGRFLQDLTVFDRLRFTLPISRMTGGSITLTCQGTCAWIIRTMYVAMSDFA
jgi:hypothetical protein